jgi:hypothetical protein
MLVEMLAADVVVYGDGGGKAPSWPEPIYGRDRVAKSSPEAGREWRAAPAQPPSSDRFYGTIFSTSPTSGAVL